VTAVPQDDPGAANFSFRRTIMRMKTSMKFRTILATHLGAMILGASVSALAAENVDVGKGEYEAACASCHGRTGKGDGPLKFQLANRMPDLSLLAKNNNGIFPFDRVYQIIDGQQEVKTHGPREMPVWGRAFRMQSSVFFENYPPYDSESAARSRILALTEYLYRLQAK
jgi:mono/diheme cytochrome c family protein